MGGIQVVNSELQLSISTALPHTVYRFYVAYDGQKC